MIGIRWLRTVSIIVLPFFEQSAQTAPLSMLARGCKGVPCSCAGQEETVLYLHAFAADAAAVLCQLTVKPGSVARPITCRGRTQL